MRDLDEAANLVRADYEVVYGDAGYQGAPKRPEIAARKGQLKTMPAHDRTVESRKASPRAKVEHPFLIVNATSDSPRPATAGSPRTGTTCTCCSPQRTG